MRERLLERLIRACKSEFIVPSLMWSDVSKHVNHNKESRTSLLFRFHFNKFFESLK